MKRKTWIITILFFCSLSIAVTADTWSDKTNTPETGGYGEAMVSTGTYVYVLKCSTQYTNPDFWRYNPASDTWQDMSITGLTTGTFRNGTAMAWDYSNNTIYALAGARYSDSNRREFYEYSISTDQWSRMTDSPNPQGAGDSITYSNYDNYIYALLGSSDASHGLAFARYDPGSDTWTSRTDPSDYVDDGSSLVWTGDHYLYALRGEYYESSPLQDFWRYNISGNSWSTRADIPDTDGVGDGGSLIWIGNWLPGHSDYIYALSGGAYDETPGYNFYRYSISGNSWDQLADLPYPVGYYNGCRLGFASNHIYYWQGMKWDDPGGGDQFYMYEFTEESPTPTPTPTSPPQDITINEIRTDQSGGDTDEYFELAGTPGTSLEGLTYLVIGDGSTASGSGVLECAVDLSGQSIQPNGFFLCAEDTFGFGGIIPDLVLTPNALNFENGDNVTHLLVTGFSGSTGDDLDTNDDGILDVNPWTEIIDLIALVLEENPPSDTEFHYGPPMIGPDDIYVPVHVYRCPDETGTWIIGDYNMTDDTPGTLNDCEVSTSTPTHTGTPSPMPTDTPTFPPTDSPIPSATAQPTVTPEPTETPTAIPSYSPTPTPTETSEPPLIPATSQTGLIILLFILGIFFLRVGSPENSNMFDF